MVEGYFCLHYGAGLHLFQNAPDRCVLATFTDILLGPGCLYPAEDTQNHVEAQVLCS